MLVRLCPVIGEENYKRMNLYLTQLGNKIQNALSV